MTTCQSCGDSLEKGQEACSNCGSKYIDDDSSSNTEQYRNELLIERVADLTRTTSLASVLPGDIYPPYFLVGLLLFVDYGVIQTYNHLFTDNISWISNPTNLTLGLGLIVAVVGVRYMADQYALAVESLQLDDRPDTPDSAPFETLIPFRVKLGVYFMGLLVYYLNLFLGPGAQTIISIEGTAKFVIGQFLLAPLVNLVLVPEFTLLFIGIMFILPQRIAQADLDLFFYDPRNMGGLGTVGQLLKRSYYIYTAGVIVYFFVAYGDAIGSAVLNNPYPEPGIQVAAFFTSGHGECHGVVRKTASSVMTRDEVSRTT